MIDIRYINYNILSGGKTKKLDSNEVDVTNCHKGTCKLRRKTDVGIVLKFTPGMCSIIKIRNNIYYIQYVFVRGGY